MCYMGMGKKLLVSRCCLLLMEVYLVLATEISVGEKEDAAIPVVTESPPEGNMTFIDGTTWCIARSGVSQMELQNALDWACGLGSADCSAIQEGGACFKPDNLLSHASYAFNSYYQQNGNNDVACNFGGAAVLTKRDPSYDNCDFAAPGRSSSPPECKYKPRLWLSSLIAIFGFVFILSLEG